MILALSTVCCLLMLFVAFCIGYRQGVIRGIKIYDKKIREIWGDAEEKDS